MPKVNGLLSDDAQNAIHTEQNTLLRVSEKVNYFRCIPSVRLYAVFGLNGLLIVGWYG